MQKITLTRPDDWHLHLRDGAALAAVLPHTAERFARAIVMPNLKPPVTATAQALAYRKRILDTLPKGARFEPLMTLYLTDNTTAQEIAQAKASGHIAAVKYYPAGATTNSESGVTALSKTYTALAAMEEHDLPLLLHSEVTGDDVDVFDREKVFIDRHLNEIVKRFPKLRIVLEHITTLEAVEFVHSTPRTIAATITAHHLLFNRNAMFEGGIRPHYYCLPVLKREKHRAAVLGAAISGNPKFFLGTDSAPHGKRAKESACGCAGIYTAHVGIELYAEAFEQAGALDKLEGFASFYGADFYRLPRNKGSITLTKQAWDVPREYALGDDALVPLRAGQQIGWKLVGGQ
ncbi:MAG: dihydroorotase [Gammaproteobacteria bacterium]|nr:dihydroorotase [Gammaproteobacteria bacterium]